MRDVRHTSRVALLVVAAAMLCAPALALRPVPPGVDPAEVEIAARAILCDCGCHPQAVYDCACGRADEMWQELSAEVGGGMTGEEVIASYVERFGETVLVTPDATGFNLLAWIGPAIGFVVAGGILFVMLRRWTARNRPAVAAAPTGEVQSVDPAYLERLRKDMEELS